MWKGYMIMHMNGAGPYKSKRDEEHLCLCLALVPQKKLKKKKSRTLNNSVRVYLVLKEEDYVMWSDVQSFLQVGGQLLLPNDVPGCWRSLSWQGDAAGDTKHRWRSHEVLLHNKKSPLPDRIWWIHSEAVLLLSFQPSARTYTAFNEKGPNYLQINLHHVKQHIPDFLADTDDWILLKQEKNPSTSQCELLTSEDPHQRPSNT